MVNRNMKAVSVIVMMCAVLAFACAGHAGEAIIFDGYGAAGHEAADAPQLHVEYVEQVQAPQMDYVIQESPAAVQPAQGNADERWYRVTYYDLDGAEIMYYTLREGERVEGPGFTPYRQDLDFQYWYDYDQIGGPVPFTFGWVATRDLNLVPYYHYPPEGHDMTYVVYDDGRTVADVAQGIIQDFVSQEMAASNVDVMQMQEVMSEEESQQLVAGILMESVQSNIDNAVGHASVISEEATDRLITGILVEVVQENMGSALEAPSAFSQEETDLLVTGILSDNVEGEMATAGPEAGTAAPAEAAELLIGEMLSGEGSTAWPDAPEAGTAINNEEAGEIIAEILVENSTEEPAGAADEAAAVMRLEDADQIIAKLLDEHANAGLPEETGLPEQDVDAGEVLIETGEVQQAEEEGGVLISGVFWEELLSGGPADNVETKITTAMSDEHVEATIANIISGSVMVSAMSEPPAEAVGEVVIHEEQAEETDETVQTPEEGVMPDGQADDLISDMLSQETAGAPQEEESVITVNAGDDEEAMDQPSTDERDLLIFAGETPSEEAELLVMKEPATEEQEETEADTPDTNDQQTQAQETSQEEAYTPEHEEAPWLEVQYSSDGEIVPGSLVTLTATVHNVDPNARLHYQWENNASGSFQAVPTAVGRVYTFVADESNTACEWRVNIVGE